MRLRKSERHRKRPLNPEAEIEWQQLVAEARQRDAARVQALDELGLTSERLQKAWRYGRKSGAFKDFDGFVNWIIAKRRETPEE